MNPIDAIWKWYSSLPKAIALLIADRVLWAVDRRLLTFSEDVDKRKKFQDWLTESSDNPFFIAAKAATFRSIFEILVEENFRLETWGDRNDLVSGFLEIHPDSEFASKTLRENEFQAAHWHAQEKSWKDLVQNYLSNVALRKYIDARLDVPR